MILSEPTMMKKIFFNLDTPDWVKYTSKLFYLLPCFQFAKIFADITGIACSSFDAHKLTWVKSTRTFKFEDIYEVKTGTFFSNDRF